MEVSEAIKYVGVDDPDLDLFESQYPMEEGVSYNSYVILDDKIAVMDTVDPRGTEEWKGKLLEVLGDRKPDYLVVQHMEPDHSGSIGWITQQFPEMKLVGTAKTKGMLPQFVEVADFENRFQAVGEGDELSLGSHTLKFALAPMVHWPEVMVTYEISEKVLFSADAFGTFGTIASGKAWRDEALHYYANIVGKYGASAQALLKKAAALDIEKILPLHGPVLTENLGYYIGLYDKWSKYEPEEEGIFMPYASIHGNTKRAVLQFAKELEEMGEKVRPMDLCREDVSEAVEMCFLYDRIIFASVTYDGVLFPAMEDLLYHLEIKNFQNRKVGIIENGSWGPMAAKKMREHLEKMKNMEIVEPVITIKSTRKESDAENFKALAEAMKKA